MLLTCRHELVVSVMVVFLLSVSGDEKNRAVGQDVVFETNPTLQSGQTITWKFKGGDKMIRVVEFQRGEAPDPQNPLFKSYAIADQTSGKLTLNNLMKNHSGEYFYEIDGKEQVPRVTLNVMDEVPTPVILQEKAKTNPDVVYLICQYNKTIDVKTSSCECKNGENPHVLNQTSDGYFTYSKTGNPEACCTCTLENAVSRKSSEPLCERMMFPGEINMAGVVIGVIFFIILFIPIALVLLYLFNDTVHDYIHPKCKSKPCFGESQQTPAEANVEPLNPDNNMKVNGEDVEKGSDVL